MDFQVIPRRKFKKRSVNLLILILMISSLIVVLGNLSLAVLDHFNLYYARFPFQGTGFETSITFPTIYFLFYVWRLRRHQRRLQRALHDFDLVQLTKDGKVGLFLYLRSFRLGRSTLLRRLVPFAYGDQSLLDATLGKEAFHIEEDISSAIHPYGLLVAIGDRGDSYGAPKVVVSDEKWQDRFHQLATNSNMIYMQPDLTQSVRWEVDQLLSNESYLLKTAWVMPRSGKGKWTETRDGLQQDIGLVLPQHQANGGIFRLSPDFGDVIDTGVFTGALIEVLEEANRNSRQFDVEQVWERARANERSTDQRLREIRKRVALLR